MIAGGQEAVWWGSMVLLLGLYFGAGVPAGVFVSLFAAVALSGV